MKHRHSVHIWTKPSRVCSEEMHSLCVSVIVGLSAAFVSVVAADSTVTTSTTTAQSTTDCASLNSSCGACIANPSCMWCESNNGLCLLHPGGIPSSDYCSLSNLRWGTCWVNFEALLIAAGVIGGILLISLIICVCCCYRRCGQRCAARREHREEELSNAEFQERRVRNDARRAERQVKYDDIRRKYGLSNGEGSSSSTPYSRFDNEA